MTERKIQPYNLKRPDCISRNQLRSLHLIHDRFARTLSSAMSAYLRTVVEVSLEDIRRVTYGEFLNSISDPTCYAATSVKPLDGLGALELGPGLVFSIIDRLLGGAGSSMTVTRPMTEIERKIIQGVLKLILDNLRESWRPAYSIEFAVTSTETSPHMLPITAASEMVLHFQFQVRMREVPAKMHLVIPKMVLDPIIHIFDQEEFGARKVIHGGIMAHLLGSIPVNVTIGTAETPFPMQSLVSLQVGDTLVLDQRQDAKMILKVAGKNKLYAKARMDPSQRVFVVTGQTRPGREGPVNAHE